MLRQNKKKSILFSGFILAFLVCGLFLPLYFLLGKRVEEIDTQFFSEATSLNPPGSTTYQTSKREESTSAMSTETPTFSSRIFSKLFLN